MDAILELLSYFVRWVFDRKIRLQLLGYRPEIICFVQKTGDGQFLLVRQRANPTKWSFPQEGINNNESYEDAATRCLNTELGVPVNRIHYLRCVWAGKQKFEKNRWGERDLDISLRKIYSKYGMIGKGYFCSLQFLDEDTELDINPAEIIEVKWVDFYKVMEVIQNHNEDKRHILSTGVQELGLS